VIINLNEIINALLGGLLIGLAVSLMLLFNGRVTGISGIIFAMIDQNFKNNKWRYFFLLGLLLGGLIIKIFSPERLVNTLSTSLTQLILAGFLVGFGTVLGSGCTSGHGICGVSRLSYRSITATLTFMIFGIISVYIVKNIFGSL
jgi:uncharacterized protein